MFRNVQHLCILVSMLFTGFAVAEEQIDFADCRTVADPQERLRCYDQMSTAPAATKESAPAPERASTQVPTASTTTIEVESTSDQAEEQNSAWKRMFGKRERAPQEKPREIRSRIVAVQQSPLGNDVLTLENGQVWMENEPSTRRSESDQEVVIREQRFSFTMVLESGRRLKVHRVR